MGPRGAGRGRKRKWDEEEPWVEETPKGGGGSTNYSVSLTSVPLDYTHDTLVELHEALGLDVDTLQSSKFMPPTTLDSRGTCAVMLRYVDRHSAESAADALRGQPVTGGDNVMRELEAEVKATHGVTQVHPSVYISDVPVEYDESRLREMHLELDPNYSETLAGFKLLHSKDPTGETRCVIARYLSDEAAEKAITMLRGKRLYLSSGAFKHLGARMAKPAAWMVQTGVADKQMEKAHQSSLAKRRREEEELPVGKPLRGRVKCWKEEAGFGFITPTDIWAPDCFVHRTVLADGRLLQVDSPVTFVAEWDATRGKYVATSCTGAEPEVLVPGGALPMAAPEPVVAWPPAQPVAPVQHQAMLKVQHPAPTGDKVVPTGVLLTGKVKYWHAEKAFGFLRPTRGGADVYIHRNGMMPIFDVSVGHRLSFEAYWNPERGNYAASVVFDGTEGVDDTKGTRWSVTGEDADIEVPAEAPEPSDELVTFAAEWNLDLPTVEWLTFLPGVVRDAIIAKFLQGDGAADRDPSLVTDAGESLRAVAAQIDLRRVRDETSNSDPAAVAAAIETVQASASTAQRLFVSGLYADATEASVREILSLYGDVVECKMLPASMMERAALVTMADDATAQRVVNEQHGRVPHSMATPIAVKLAGATMDPNVSDNIFVAGLPSIETQEFIAEHFGAIGPIRSVKMLKARSDSHAALVRMLSPELATIAIDTFHMKYFPLTPTQMIVRYAENTTDKRIHAERAAKQVAAAVNQRMGSPLPVLPAGPVSVSGSPPPPASPPPQATVAQARARRGAGAWPPAPPGAPPPPPSGPLPAAVRAARLASGGGPSARPGMAGRPQAAAWGAQAWAEESWQDGPHAPDGSPPRALKPTSKAKASAPKPSAGPRAASWGQWAAHAVKEEGEDGEWQEEDQTGGGGAWADGAECWWE